MPCRSRHHLSLLRLVRPGAGFWRACALTFFLVLSNVMAAVAPMHMMPAAISADMAAMHHSMGMDADVAAAADSMAAMHHHPADSVTDGAHSAASVPHARDCPCCVGGHCDCLQACNPLPQVDVALIAAPLRFAEVPAPMQTIEATSIVDSPPLRPPIA